MAEQQKTTSATAWQRCCLQLALVLGVALVPRLLAIAWTVSPARDAFRYLDAASAFQRLPFRAALRSIDAHPLYPLSLLMVHDLWARLDGCNEPMTWLRAGQAWSVACYLAFLVLAYAAGALLWSPRIACLGCVALAVLPRQVFYSVDLLTDNLHALFWMASFLLQVLWFRTHRLAAAMSAGLCAGLAYWTRMEAILLPCVFGASVIAMQCCASWRIAWKHWVAAVTLFGAGFLSLAGPYVALTGRISPKNSTNALLGGATTPEVRIRSPLPRRRGMPIGNNASPVNAYEIEPAPEGARRDLWGAILRLGFEIGQETRGWLLLLAVYPLVDRRRSRLAFPVGLPVLFGFAGCAAMLVLLEMKAGYLAGRYLTPLLPLFAMSAMTGAEALLGRAVRWKRLPWEQTWSAAVVAQRRRVAGVASLAVLALGLCVPHLLKPLHGYRYGHMLAARWLAAHSTAGEAVFDPMACSAFFAGRPRWHPPLGRLDGPPPRYTVVDPVTMNRNEPRVYHALEQVMQTGQLVAAFPRTEGSEQTGVWVFELPVQVGWKPTTSRQ